MADRREITRAEARRRRAIKRQIAAQTASAVCEKIEYALTKARRIMTDKSFKEILNAHGVNTVPQCLARNNGSHAPSEEAGVANGRLDEASLQFAIAWAFLFPLIGKPEIANHLENKWPGFVWEIKDAFIALVVEGPFPHAMSGHRSRRHGARYQPIRRRMSRGSLGRVG